MKSRLLITDDEPDPRRMGTISNLTPCLSLDVLSPLAMRLRYQAINPRMTPWAIITSINSKVFLSGGTWITCGKLIEIRRSGNPC